jgi:hypothetical protein
MSKRTLRAEELARDVEGFASNDDNLLAVEQLLGHDAGQATEKVSLAIDNNLESENELSAMCVLLRWLR